MELLTKLIETLSSKIDISLVILIVAIGEIVKKYWTSEKPNSFFKIALPSLIIASFYGYFSKLHVTVIILSYLLSFWLYPFLVKPLMKKLGLKKEDNEKEK